MPLISTSKWYRELDLIARTPNLDDLRVKSQALVVDPKYPSTHEIMRHVALTIKLALLKARFYSIFFNERVVIQIQNRMQTTYLNADAIAQRVREKVWGSEAFFPDQADRLQAESGDVIHIKVTLRGSQETVDLINAQQMQKFTQAHLFTYFAQEGGMRLDDHLPDHMHIAPEDFHLFINCLQGLPFFVHEYTDAQMVKLFCLAYYLDAQQLINKLCNHCKLEGRYNAGILLGLSILEPNVFERVIQLVSAEKIAPIYVSACFKSEETLKALRIIGSDYYGKNVDCDYSPDIKQYYIGDHGVSAVGEILRQTVEDNVLFADILFALRVELKREEIRPEDVLAFIPQSMRHLVDELDLFDLQGFSEESLEEFLRQFPNATEISMPSYAPDAWYRVLDGCQPLYHLSVGGDSFTGIALSNIDAKHSQCYSLTIKKSPKFDHRHLQFLTFFSELSELKFEHTPLKPFSLDSIQQVRTLHSLYFNKCFDVNVPILFLKQKIRQDFSFLSYVEVSGLEELKQSMIVKHGEEAGSAAYRNLKILMRIAIRSVFQLQRNAQVALVE